jgi:hypothetical protein
VTDRIGICAHCRQRHILVARCRHGWLCRVCSTALDALSDIAEQESGT